MTGHLTDEQFADLLAGEEANTAAELHLEGCEHCRYELSTLSTTAAEFHALSLAWAQVEAPRRITPPTRFQRLVGRGGPVWALGLSAALVAGMVTIHISTPLSVDRRDDTLAASTSRSASSELAADNRLMQSINSELQYRSEPAVPVHELRVSVRRIAQPSAAAAAN